LLLLAPQALADDGYGGARTEWVDAGVHQPVLTKAPALLHAVEPAFPEEAKADQLTGDVTMAVEIRADGTVGTVEVTQPAGHGFDAAAVAAVKQFVFSPAEIDDVPAAVRISYTQHFFFTAPPPPDAGPEAPPEVDAGPPAPAYPVSFTGRILERASRKPLPGAALEAFTAGASAEDGGAPFDTGLTETDGTFAMRLPPGPVHLRVREGSHRPYETDETIKPGERVEATYYLMPRGVGLYETVVKGERDPKEVSRHTLEREELEKVPGSMGDPIRVIQDMPGVARAAFLSGALIVRGASSDETQTYIDGVPIPQLFHFLGGPSVISPEFIEKLDFYPGGFGAQYGRAIGGTVDVATRSPKDDSVHGSVKLDLIDEGLYVSAPVTRELTVSAAARRSALDFVIPVVLPLLTDSGIVVVPTYYDYQLRLDYKPQALPGHTFKLFFFGSDDQLKVATTGSLSGANFSLNNHIDFQRVLGTWAYRHGPLSLTTTGYVGRSGFSLGVGLFQVDSSDVSGGLRHTAELELGKHFTLRGGLDVDLDSAGYSARLPAFPLNFRPFPGESPERPNMVISGSVGEYDYAGWVEGELKLPGRVKVIPGVRVDLYRLLGQTRPSAAPRLIARWDLGAEDRPWTLKGSVGLYNQSPGAVNLDSRFGNPDLSLEKAFQTSLGVEHKFTDAIHVEVTGFYNRRYDLAEGTNDIVVGSDGTRKRVLVESIGLGRAYGIEVLARHEITQHFFGWIAYTLSWSEERNHGEPYALGINDQRHILTVIGQYKFGNGWELGGRFRLTSGVPSTPTTGAVLDTDTQVYNPVYGATDSSRQPTFHQLDLRVDRVFLFDQWTLGLYLDVQNVYNHTNQEGIIPDYRYNTALTVPDIPILPTLGVKGSF
jgi:TonB family protein